MNSTCFNVCNLLCNYDIKIIYYLHCVIYVFNFFFCIASQVKANNATSRPFVNHLMVCFMRINTKINLIKSQQQTFSIHQVKYYVLYTICTQSNFL